MITDKNVEQPLNSERSSKHFGNFASLNDFQSSLETCKVTDVDGAPLRLVEALNQSVSRIQEITSKGKKVIFIGNGGSAAICSHLSTDLWKNGGARAVAFNDTSLITCAANDFGYEYVFSKPLAIFADPGDILIAISSSGGSANILNGVQAARDKGCSVLGFSGFTGENPLRTKADLNYFIDSKSYGVVEVAHLLLIHAIVDEYIRASPVAV